MKKIFAMAVLALSALCAQAGDFYVGGQAGFWHESDNESSTNQLSILPEVGYNFSENWAVGSTLGYEYTHLCGTGVSSHIFAFRPYLRWTYLRANKVSLFLDGTAGIGAGWTHYGHGIDDSKTAVTWNVGIRPGVALSLTDHFSLVAHVGMLGYEGTNDAAKAAGYKDQGGLLLNGNNLSFGFYYTF